MFNPPTDEEIAELESKLADAKKAKADFDAHAEPFRLAIFLHSSFCQHNHTDGCSWGYETDPNLWQRSAHAQYLKMANALLTIVSYNTAIQVVKEIVASR